MYPLNTNLYYGKLLGKPEKDCLLVTHRVEIKGNRQYLVSVSADHTEYPPQGKSQRVKGVTHANYFEPTADGKGVKHILVAQLDKTKQSDLVRSFGKEGTNQIHLTSLTNLKELLIGTRQTSAPTSYLTRVTEENQASSPEDSQSKSMPEITAGKKEESKAEADASDTTTAAATEEPDDYDDEDEEEGAAEAEDGTAQASGSNSKKRNKKKKK